jgi:ribosomal protein L37AE/L43A
MRVERTNSEGWKRPGENKQERVPLCPVCGSQGLELRKNAGTNFLCISCNHTWGS